MKDGEEEEEITYKNKIPKTKGPPMVECVGFCAD